VDLEKTRLRKVARPSIAFPDEFAMETGWRCRYRGGKDSATLRSAAAAG